MFSGNKNTDILILEKLEIEDLLKVSTVSKYMRKLYNDENLWLTKLRNIFPNFISYKPVNISFRQFYIQTEDRIRNVIQRKKYSLKNNKDLSENNKITEKYLLEIDRKYNITPLVAEMGYIEIIKFLHFKDSKLYFKDTDDDDSLYKACSYGNLEVVKFLVENGADIHVWNDASLRISCLWGYLDIVKFLVENGANIYALNKDCFSVALKNNHLHVLEYLNNKC